MTDKELAREIRKQRRLEKLGTNSPICGTCGEADYRTLEKHHVAGRKYDPDTVIACRNCHRKVSDDQKDHPAIDANADAMLSAIGMFLLGLVDLLELVIDKLSAFGLALIERAKLAGGEHAGETVA
ncbi:MAG: hypothetical protein K2Q29_12465 [Sphingomonadales bacterium]|nr:hypothetical protein [Sphingomonadales bacterium]